MPGWTIVYGVTRVRCASTSAWTAGGACASSTLPTPVACIGSRDPIVLTTGHRGVAREPVEVEHLGPVAHGEVDGGQRRAVEVVQVRRGDLAQPGLHRREQTDVPQPPADDVLPRRRAGSAHPTATSSPTSRWAVGTGSSARSASSVSESRRWSSSKAPSSDSARLVTVAPGVEMLPAMVVIIPLAGRRSR